MDNIRKKIYLAAILHDIGKFYQRADSGLMDRYNSLSRHSKDIASDICPVNEYGRFGYQHVVWTNEFIEKNQSMLAGIPGIADRRGLEVDDSLANLACNHHKPMSELQAIIALADWWSAGVDRNTKGHLEVENETALDKIHWGKQRYKKIPLFSIFNKINDGHGNYGFPLTALNIDSRCFPYSIASCNDGVDEQKYMKLWTEFTCEFEHLPTDSFEGFAESLLYLLKKYTWCIPSNTMDMSDVSLMDHLKTTAAFADSLYCYYAVRPEAFNWDSITKRLKVNSDERPVMLLGGDISGIQKFIYDISSNKAAVSLKGRSFYLQLLIDSVIQRIIDHKDIDCTVGQVVYSSGGKFYMILPNTPAVCSAIKELKMEFEKELWDEHYGNLSLSLDYVPFLFSTETKKFSFEEEREVEIGRLWKRLADKLTRQKEYKFRSVLTDGYDIFFTPREIDAKAKVCAVTGIESTECENIGDGTFVLKSVKSQADLGKTLKDADYLITYRERERSSYLSNRAKCDIGIAKIHNYLFDKTELTINGADFRSITSADVCRVKSINNCNFLDAQIKGQKISYGFQFYGGNKQAQVQGRDKTFEELADGQYLGVLRMDVDNLGAIFINGLPESSKSFSSYSTLSFMLDLFFSGYLNTIRQKNEYRNDVNILYSGGDDVFAVGRWDKLILFAEEIRTSFECFTGRNDITISGGITIVGSKFPIAKAAAIAGEAEEKAKRNEKKNTFNMFGENISWEKDEYFYVKAKKEKFVELCSQFAMPRSILHKLMVFCQMMKKNNCSYIWNTIYFLTRFSEGKSDEVKAFCNSLRNELCSARRYELMATAARWAELELKMISIKD